MGPVLTFAPSKLEVDDLFLSDFPAPSEADASGVFEDEPADKSNLLERVGLDLLLAMTRLAGLASTGGKSPMAAVAAAAAFAFSLSVVALVLCLTVLLRYSPSGSSAEDVFRWLVLEETT